MISTFSLQQMELEESLDKILLPPTDPNAEVTQITGIEELSTEIEPGIVGVKASDLCQRLSIEMVDSNEEN